MYLMLRGCFCAVVVLLSAAVSAVDVKIWPHVPLLFLEPGDNLTLKCTGDAPVKWTFTRDYDYDSSLFVHEDSSTKTSQKLANNSHISLLTLSDAHYLNAGFYSCTPEELEYADQQHSKRIYLFFQPKENVFAFTEPTIGPLNWIIEFGDFIIPCRPSSSDVNVTLLKNEKKITEGEHLKYDQEIGFILKSPSIQDSGVYNCLSSRDNEILESHSVDVIFNTEVNTLVQPHIYNENAIANYAIVGQNVSLDCRVSVDLAINFTVTWKIPDRHKLENGHRQASKRFIKSEHNYYQMMASHILNIHNVSVEDGGEYVCEVETEFGKRSHTAYALKVIATDATYLNLTAQDGVNEIKTKAGTPELNWLIKVSANPKPIFTCYHKRHSNGEDSTECDQETTSIESDESSTKLIIRDLSVYDSGIYELVANNGAHIKRIAVTLVVQDKPRIIRTPHEVKYYEAGRTFSKSCHVTGYPLPAVKWIFKKCPNYPDCEEAYLNVSRTMYKEIKQTVFETFMLTSTLNNVTANETVIVFCVAENEYGIDSRNITFLFTGGSKPTTSRRKLVLKKPELEALIKAKMSTLSSPTAEASDEHRLQMTILSLRLKQEVEKLKREKLKTELLQYQLERKTGITWEFDSNEDSETNEYQ